MEAMPLRRDEDATIARDDGTPLGRCHVRASLGPALSDRLARSVVRVSEVVWERGAPPGGALPCALRFADGYLFEGELVAADGSFTLSGIIGPDGVRVQ
jgi:hypothetical protein